MMDMQTSQPEFTLHSAARDDIQYRLLGAIPLLPGEEASELEALWQEVRHVLQPVDFMDKIWARDFVKLFWEERRLYRLKAEFLKSSAHLGLEQILKHHVSHYERQDFINKWVQGDPKTLKEVNAILAKSGLTRESITAETFVLKIKELENIDRMIAAHEARRNQALKELSFHREFVARSLIKIAHHQRDPLPIPD
jgi:hypothetical protein